MSNKTSATPALPQGVMLNAYPDSIGETMSDIVSLLKRPDFDGVFSMLYVLPTFFHSDLDRGFSIVDYDLNELLVSPQDLDDLKDLEIGLKLDLVLNHLSMNSPQFQDVLKNGDESEYKDFFIDWNAFWGPHGYVAPEGYVVPKQEFLDRLFMRKHSLPILEVRFPDGSEKFYWNTFYQEVTYGEMTPADRARIKALRREETDNIYRLISEAGKNANISKSDLEDLAQRAKDQLRSYTKEIVSIVERNRGYLGQVDLNAECEAVWTFFRETIDKLHGYGAEVVRLDAFAYLHKVPGEVNFFNVPGSWEQLDRLREMADVHGLVLLPEIHSEYGKGLHEELASHGFPIYDFFFPGLVIDAIDRATNRPLLRWIGEIQEKGIRTVNMLGCHDGIPVLDLKGDGGAAGRELLTDAEIEAVIDRIVERGGKLKDIFSVDGKKISYYQVNATFFSALGEDDQRLLLARAIQLFMPGTPQIWYLDLFAGRNDYDAVDKGGAGGGREINRSSLTLADVEERLQWPVVRHQLDLIRLRNNFPAFGGELIIGETEPHLLEMIWRSGEHTATLQADLRDQSFAVRTARAGKEEHNLSFSRSGQPPFPQVA